MEAKETAHNARYNSLQHLPFNEFLPELVKTVTLSSFIYQVINGIENKSEKSWQCHFQDDCSLN